MTDGIRATRQRQVVVEALDDLETFCSAQEVHAALAERGETVGLATVYRTLQLFADSGSLDALRGDDGETRYRQCTREQHHHHLVCRSCGHTEEVADSGVELWAHNVAAERGFTATTHTMEIFGLCPTCSPDEADAPQALGPPAT